MDFETLVIIGAGLLFGVSIGVGVALGFEIVMRASGDGRCVVLTWARVKDVAQAERNET
jgi:hypothetical protein